jgi:hypothetical protein
VVRVFEAPKDVAAWQASRREALGESLPAWHRQEAATSARASEWFAAAFHLNRLIQAEPQDGMLYLRHGLALVGQGTASGRKISRKR